MTADNRTSCDETRAAIATVNGRIDGLYLVSAERHRQVDTILVALLPRVGELESKVAASSGRSVGIGVVVAILLSLAAIVATLWK